jgi:predicted acetyltransferase
MSQSGLLISKIGPESDILLRNLLEHYIHDMSEWFQIDTQADGSYSYNTFLVWKNGYDAYLANVGDSIAGFALVGST